MRQTSATLALFDNEKNRRKEPTLTKMEIMFDDSDNEIRNPQKFWDNLEDFLEWGKKYKLTIEEIKKYEN